MADLSTEQVETLGILSEVLADSSFTVLSMLLGKDIELAPMRSDIIKADEIAAENKPFVIGKVQFGKSCRGQMFYFFYLRDATALIDLMLGGEGESSDQLDDDSSDALNETINQIMGATCQTLSEKSGSSITVDQVVIADGADKDFVAKTCGSPEFGGVEFSLFLDGILDSKAFVGLDKALLESLTQVMNKKAAAPEPEAPQSAPVQDYSNKQQTQVASAPSPVYSNPNIELLMDIELPVIIRIGRTELLLQDILKLTPGAIIELNKASDDPIDMLVNNKLVARGEVVVVEGNFAFRITEIVSTSARIRSLGPT
ncbi:MAG: flagellar motor switch protein FliN [Acidobacteria bacterium]|nr:flagellar motor switch protein FliN [Acidobacteriota bacterium]